MTPERVRSKSTKRWSAPTIARLRTEITALAEDFSLRLLAALSDRTAREIFDADDKRPKARKRARA